MDINQEIMETFTNNFTSGTCEVCQYEKSTCLCDGTKKCIHCFNIMYKINSPSYNWCSHLRDAYILKYFFVHRAELQKTLSIFQKEIVEILNNDWELKIGSIGPGPGTDFTAVVDMLVEIGGNVNLKFFFVEKDQNWSIQFNKIYELYKKQINKYRITCTLKTTYKDVLDIETTTGYMDVFLLSYVISEILTVETEFNEVDKIWSWMKDCIKDGGLILLNDRNERMIRQFFDLFEKSVLETYPRSEVIKYYFNPSGEMIEYGGLHPLRSHCRVSIEEDFQRDFQPKRHCNSCQLAIIIRKEK